MKRRFLFLLLCAPCMFINAQQDSLNYYLDEVVVVKSKTTKEVVPVQELRGEELEKLNALSVADALRFFSGVQLKDYGGIGGLKTINVRSMGGEHVGVFYDGVEISNPQNGIVDLGRFSLENMEAISLYNGQKSNLLQSAKDFASGSAIYMKSKVPSFSSFKSYNLKLNFRTGAFDLINPSILWQQKINENISSSLYLEYLNSSGKYKYTYKLNNNLDDRKGYDTTAIRRNGDIEVWKIEHTLNGKIKDGEWETKAYLYRSDRGYPGAVIRQSSSFLSDEDRQNDLSIFFQGRYKKQLSEIYTTQLLAKYAYDYVHYKSDTLINKYDNRYKLHDAYISSANRFSLLPFWSVNVSADYQYNKMDADLSDFTSPQRNTFLVAFSSSIYWNRIKIQGSLLYSLINDKTHIYSQIADDKGNTTSKLTEIKKDSQNKFTPSFVASWQPFEKEQLFIRSYYKNIFRMPTFSEMYMVTIGGIVSPLKPETSHQYDVGFAYTKKLSAKWGIDIQIDGYYNEVKNKLMAIGGGANFRWTILNKGKVKIKGLDISLASNYDISSELSVSGKLNYTYQDAKDYTPMKVQSDSIYYKGQIPYIPWNSGSAIVGINYKTWAFNYSFVYTGKRYSNSANLSEYIIKPWNTHDLSISKYFKLQNSSLKGTIEVNNIFNQSYEIISRYPMPGTNFRFAIQWNI